MAVNRFVLNGISYHGHGAINEIPGIVKSKGFKMSYILISSRIRRLRMYCMVSMRIRLRKLIL